MIPKRVVLENFLSFGPRTEILFRDDEPLWVLSGKNGVGKSTVFDAMTFCLFGTAREVGRSTDLLIRHGAEYFKVTFEFEFNRQLYKISRNRNENGRSTQSVEQWDPVREEYGKPEVLKGLTSAAEVTEWAEGLLGLDDESFRKSVLLEQGKADEIITARPDERLKILKGIIGMEQIENVYSEVVDGRKLQDASWKSLQAQYLQLRDVTSEELAAAEAAVTRAGADSQAAEAARERALHGVSLAATWEKLLSERAEIRAKIDAAEGRRTTAEQIRNDFGQWKKLEEILPRLSEWIPLRDSLPDRESRLRDLEAQFDVERGTLEELQETRDRLETASQEAERNRSAVKNEIPQLRKAIDGRTRQIALVGEIHTLEAQWKAFPADLESQADDAQVGAEAAAGAEQQARDHATSCKTRHDTIKAEKTRLKGLKTGVKCSSCGQLVDATHADKERKRIDVELANAKDALEVAINEHTRCKQQLDAISARAKALTALRRDRERTGDLLKAKREQSAIWEESSDLKELQQKNIDDQQWLDSLDLPSLEARLAETDREIRRIDAQISASNAALTKLDLARADHERKLIADRATSETLAKTFAPEWQTTTSAELQAHQATHARLQAAGIVGLNAKLAEDFAHWQRWNDTEAALERQMEATPPENRLTSSDAQSRIAQSKVAFDKAQEALESTRDAAKSLQKHAADRAGLRQQILGVEQSLARHKTLEKHLGKNGLQRELVRNAENKIVGYARSTLEQLSGGEFSISLNTSDEGNDKALDLVVQQTGFREPTPVKQLSGSQKFRVAISIALAIGRFASNQEKPLESVIIDEGFGSLDQEGLAATADVLNQLKNTLKRIILVSHQDEFTKHFPVVIELTKGERGTEARAIRR